MEFIVVGHKHPDLDSVISSYAEAERLKMRGVRASPCVPDIIPSEVREVFSYCNLELPLRWQDSMKENPTILVDHTNMEKSVGLGANICEIIDHHGETVWSKNLDNREISTCGSTCTMITDRYRKDNLRMNKEISLLLLIGIVADTKMLLSGRTTERDLEVALFLQKEYGHSIEEVKNMLIKWLCYDYNTEKKSEILSIRPKLEKINNNDIYSVGIYTSNLYSFISNKKDILDYLALNNADYHYLMISDFLLEQTVLLHTFNGIPNPYFIPGICSRNNEIKKILIDRI